MQNDFSRSVLQAMYEAARQSAPPSLKQLCSLLDAPREAVSAALVELERAGLVTARTARLTFPGLALAAASRAGASERPPVGRAIAA